MNSARCDNALCGKEFKRTAPHQHFCCKECRYQSWRRTNPPKPRKRLICKHCRGAHQTNLCPNRGPAIKQFGTLGPNREYIPPPGVNVRIMQITGDTFGDQLTKILKELDP